MFIVMFIGPLMMPSYSDSYTEVTQQNIPPNMSMMSVPKELKNDIKMIDGFGSFTVGLSNAGKVYVWGPTQIGTTGIDVGQIPQEVQDARIAMVAAGIDHIVAISEEGKVYCWGNKRLGQYGTEAEAMAADGKLNPNIAYMPERKGLMSPISGSLPAVISVPLF
jgi:peptide/nickel transport system permease protein